MADSPPSGSTHLTWGNVGLAFSFVVFDAVVSRTFSLGVGSSLVTAAVRCVIQLSLVALILRKVFETNNPWAVAGIASTFAFSLGLRSCFTDESHHVVLLNLMGTTETGKTSVEESPRHSCTHAAPQL